MPPRRRDPRELRETYLAQLAVVRTWVAGLRDEDWARPGVTGNVAALAVDVAAAARTLAADPPAGPGSRLADVLAAPRPDTAGAAGTAETPAPVVVAGSL